MTQHLEPDIKRKHMRRKTGSSFTTVAAFAVLIIALVAILVILLLGG